MDPSGSCSDWVTASSLTSLRWEGKNDDRWTVRRDGDWVRSEVSVRVLVDRMAEGEDESRRTVARRRENLVYCQWKAPRRHGSNGELT